MQKYLPYYEFNLVNMTTREKQYLPDYDLPYEDEPVDQIPETYYFTLKDGVVSEDFPRDEEYSDTVLLHIVGLEDGKYKLTVKIQCYKANVHEED